MQQEKISLQALIEFATNRDNYILMSQKSRIDPINITAAKELVNFDAVFATMYYRYTFNILKTLPSFLKT